MQYIADRIEAGMAAREFSVSRLAEASLIPRMTLSRRLADPATFTLAELERIASALGIDPFDLTKPEAA